MDTLTTEPDLDAAPAPAPEVVVAVLVASNGNTASLSERNVSWTLLALLIILVSACTLVIAALTAWYVNQQRSKAQANDSHSATASAPSHAPSSTYVPSPKKKKERGFRRSQKSASIGRADSAPAMLRITKAGEGNQGLADVAMLKQWQKSHPSAVLPGRDAKHAHKRSLASSAALLGMPSVSQQSSLSLSVMEPGISQALDTDIAAWRTCRDTTSLLPPLLVFEFDMIQSCVNTWTKNESLLLGRYKLVSGSLRVPRSLQASVATAFALNCSPDSVADTDSKSGNDDVDGRVANKRDLESADFMVKLFAGGFDRFARERDLWERKDVAQEMKAVVDFGGDFASDMVSSALHGRGHARTRSTVAKEKSVHSPTDSQGLCKQVPCIVLKKGVPVDEWVQVQQPSIAELLDMLLAVAESLQRLHSMDLVHRNIKPSNIIWLPREKMWTLCDFGCSARVGEKCTLGFSLKYAAPETIDAYESNQQAGCATTAVDVWALGVIAYEMFTQEQLFRPGTSDGEARDALMQRSKLPWEDPVCRPLHAPEFAAVRPAVLACLSRSASERISAADLVQRWRHAVTVV